MTGYDWPMALVKSMWLTKKQSFLCQRDPIVHHIDKEWELTHANPWYGFKRHLEQPEPGEQILFKSYVPVMVRVIVVIIVLDPSKWARRPGRYACAAHWPGIVRAGIVDGGWNQHTKKRTWVKLTSWKRSENECLKHHPHKTIYGALLSAANTFDIQSPYPPSL